MNKEISLTELQQDSLELSIRTDIETSQNILEDSLNELEDIKLGYSSSNYDGMNTLEQCENQIKRYRQHLRSLYAIYEKLGYDSNALKGDR